MPYFDFQGKQVYYEDHGEGEPILLLNGIMMSTVSWAMFKGPLTASNRLILLDFLDQGKSDKMTEAYIQDLQVEVVEELRRVLNLDRLNICAISYGGEIALQYAIRYPEQVRKMVLFNTTARTSPWLRDIGRAWNLSKENPLDYYLTTIPVIYSPSFYNQNQEWMETRKDLLVNQVFSNQEFMEGLERLVISAEGLDVVDALGQIQAPTLIVGSEQDFITPLAEQRMLKEKIPQAELVVLPGVGHASMYEKPEVFLAILLGFVNLENRNGF